MEPGDSGPAASNYLMTPSFLQGSSPKDTHTHTAQQLNKPWQRPSDRHETITKYFTYHSDFGARQTVSPGLTAGSNIQRYDWIRRMFSPTLAILSAPILNRSTKCKQLWRMEHQACDSWNQNFSMRDKEQMCFHFLLWENIKIYSKS